jgi:lysophospholipase L1-like esterase
MTDLERYFWLLLLGPVFWLQARHVRRVTPRLPEPPGSRSGLSGAGPLVRLLVAGDSAAAGVGASSQDEALCGQLVGLLALHHTVQWQLIAVNGLESPELVQMLEDAPKERFDVVVISMGANDVSAMLAPVRWLEWQNRLAHVVARRFNPQLLVHSAAPPLHAFTALPQPLRWFSGRWAREMNRHLAGRLAGHQRRRTMLSHPDIPAAMGLASDGLHPGPHGYSAWAHRLNQHIQLSIPTWQ